MNKPTLIIMAAGMGSRYGGLKQIDPITDAGEIIMDFSLYDGMTAGFEDVCFVIKEEMEEDFRSFIDDRAGKYLNVQYAFQRLSDLPEGYSVPDGREKPWGTAHAILTCRHMVKGPFAVINADDYYGPEAFTKLYSFLSQDPGDKMPLNFAMVSYELANTVTDKGHVARGICTVSEDEYLQHVEEKTQIESKDGKIYYVEKGTKTFVPGDTQVSMNFWGYSAPMMDHLWNRFPHFLDKALDENPMGGEYFIPAVTDGLIKEGLANVKVLHTRDKWYGVTYKEDRDYVKSALQSMKDRGLYPEQLWK